jgi:hypothetical protein
MKHAESARSHGDMGHAAAIAAASAEGKTPDDTEVKDRDHE